MKVKCSTCRKIFTLDLHTKKRNQKFCSKKCIRNVTQFKKGFTPWNKGTKGIMKAWNKDKRRPEFLGKNNPNWKGGNSLKDERKTTKYAYWRIGVFTRDDYTCQSCRKVGVYLEAHHIKKWADYPKLRYDMNNGITLCKDCHKLTDNYRNKKSYDKKLHREFIRVSR